MRAGVERIGVDPTCFGQEFVIAVGGLFGIFLATVFWDSAGKAYRKLHESTPTLTVTVQESPNAELRSRLAEKENEVARLSGVVDRLQNDLKSAVAKIGELQQQLDDRQNVANYGTSWGNSQKEEGN